MKIVKNELSPTTLDRRAYDHIYKFLNFLRIYGTVYTKTLVKTSTGIGPRASESGKLFYVVFCDSDLTEQTELSVALLTKDNILRLLIPNNEGAREVYNLAKETEEQPSKTKEASTESATLTNAKKSASEAAEPDSRINPSNLLKASILAPPPKCASCVTDSPAEKPRDQGPTACKGDYCTPGHTGERHDFGGSDF